ncbi:hypothetical protein Ciccas_011736 [Cichlidogyrus casuarinus]|uniref:USP domain-containing protein n=1 Tax=Cichlidogyrus casuarinus TaxID=1844966 RepID=A0ABD2PRA8_9PLAT
MNQQSHTCQSASGVLVSAPKTTVHEFYLNIEVGQVNTWLADQEYQHKVNLSIRSRNSNPFRMKIYCAAKSEGCKFEMILTQVDTKRILVRCNEHSKDVCCPKRMSRGAKALFEVLSNVMGPEQSHHFMSWVSLPRVAEDFHNPIVCPSYYAIMNLSQQKRKLYRISWPKTFELCRQLGAEIKILRHGNSLEGDEICLITKEMRIYWTHACTERRVFFDTSHGFTYIEKFSTLVTTTPTGIWPLAILIHRHETEKTFTRFFSFLHSSGLRFSNLMSDQHRSILAAVAKIDNCTHLLCHNHLRKAIEEDVNQCSSRRAKNLLLFHGKKALRALTHKLAQKHLNYLLCPSLKKDKGVRSCESFNAMFKRAVLERMCFKSVSTAVFHTLDHLRVVLNAKFQKSFEKSKTCRRVNSFKRILLQLEIRSAGDKVVFTDKASGFSVVFDIGRETCECVHFKRTGTCAHHYHVCAVLELITARCHHPLYRLNQDTLYEEKIGWLSLDKAGQPFPKRFRASTKLITNVDVEKDALERAGNLSSHTTNGPKRACKRDFHARKVTQHVPVEPTVNEFDQVLRFLNSSTNAVEESKQKQLTGFKNLGNSCFLNSVLQAILNSALRFDLQSQTCCCLTCEFARLKEDYSAGGNKIMAPTNLFNKLANECTECGLSTFSAVCEYLIVPVPPTDSLRQSISSEMAYTLSKRCGRCQKDTVHDCASALMDLPDILMVQIKRARQDGSVDTSVVRGIEEDIELETTGRSIVSYRLRSLIAHESAQGRSTSGHFVCYIREEASWLRASDEIVERCHMGLVQMAVGSVYFLERC